MLRTIVIGGLVLITVAAVAFGIYSVTADLPAVRDDAPVTILIVRNPPALNAVEENFSLRMQELGYADQGRANYIRIDVGTDLKSTKDRILAEMQKVSVDLLFVTGVIAAKAAKEVTAEKYPSTPIVFGVVSDPVGTGLIKDIRSSGNNITGITPANNLTASKRLEYLKEMIPSTKRIIYVWNDEKTSGVAGVRKVTAEIGLELVEKNVADSAEMTAYLRAYPYEPGDAILRSSDAVAAGAITEALKIAAENKIPFVGTNAGDTTRGALMSYGADYGEIGSAAARLADLVLKGTKPSDIPIEEASRFDISVNLETAKQIGITVPQSILLKTSILIAEN